MRPRLQSQQWSHCHAFFAPELLHEHHLHPLRQPVYNTVACASMYVQVKCKSAPAGGANRGACIVRMRLTVRFSGGLNPNIPRAGWDSALPRNINRVSTAAIGTAQTAGGQAANNLVRDLGFTCRTVAYRDLLNALDVRDCVCLG